MGGANSIIHTHMTRSSQRTLFSRLAEWALIAAIFALPWQSRWILQRGTINLDPWEYGTLSLYGVDILIFLFFICAILHYVQVKKYKPSVSVLLACFLLLIAFFSMNFATDTLVTLFWWAVLAQGVVLFLLLSRLPIRKRRIGIVFIITAVIQSLFAYFQFVIQTVPSSKWLGIAWQDPETLGVQVIEGPLGRILRGYGSLPHPNMLAGLIVVAIIICLALYIRKKPSWDRMAYAVALTVMSAGLWISFSRQAWLALSAVLVLTIISAFIQKRRFPAQLVTGILYILLPMIVLTLLFPSLIQTRLSPDARLEEKSLEERQTYTDQSFDLLQDHWATGVGIGNYTAVLQKQQDPNEPQPGHMFQPVHNIYLLIFTEIGIFGLFAWVLFVLSLIRSISWRDSWSFIGGSIIIALLIIGVFDHYLWSLHFGILLFWVCAGMNENAKQRWNLDKPK